jgi:hypothetical protein
LELDPLGAFAKKVIPIELADDPGHRVRGIAGTPAEVSREAAQRAAKKPYDLLRRST